MLKRFLADLLILILLLFSSLITYFPGPRSESLSELNLFEFAKETPGSIILAYYLKVLYEPGPGVYFVLRFVMS